MGSEAASEKASEEQPKVEDTDSKSDDKEDSNEGEDKSSNDTKEVCETSSPKAEEEKKSIIETEETVLAQEPTTEIEKESGESSQESAGAGLVPEQQHEQKTESETTKMTLPTSGSFATSEPSVTSPMTTQRSSTEGAVTPSLDEKSQCSKAEIVLDPCTLAQGTEETTKPKTPQDETSPTVEVKPKAEEEVEKWGKPLGLPSPLPPGGPSRSMNNETNNKATRKQRSERSERKVTPVYMDLAYVPHHGDANYTDIEFFKRVRARYYVFSGVEPSRAVFDALLEGKKTWENKDLEVTIIPTYDSDVLGYWVADNEDALTEHKIDLAPS